MVSPHRTPFSQRFMSGSGLASPVTVIVMLIVLLLLHQDRVGRLGSINGGVVVADLIP